MNKQSGKLDGACCYLSGPMEFVADHGVEWRRKFVALLREKNLKIDCIDPTNKPGGQDVKIGENKFWQATLQREGRWAELQKYVRSYRRYDLRFVDISDFLVVVVDPRVPQWGTGNEVYFAEMQHKPMYFVCDGGLSNLPRWLFDVIDLNDEEQGTRLNVFDNIESVVDELIALDSGQIPMTDEWVLVRKFIEDSRPRNDRPRLNDEELKKLLQKLEIREILSNLEDNMQDWTDNEKELVRNFLLPALQD